MHGGGPGGDLIDLVHRGPWAHLARHFKGILSNLERCPGALSSRSSVSVDVQSLSQVSVFHQPSSNSPLAAAFVDPLPRCLKRRPLPCPASRRRRRVEGNRRLLRLRRVQGPAALLRRLRATAVQGANLLQTVATRQGRSPLGLASRLGQFLLPFRFPSSDRDSMRRELKGMPISPRRRQQLAWFRDRRGRRTGTLAVVQWHQGKACNRLMLRCGSRTWQSWCNLKL